jgi:hypothetical protein
LAHARRKFFELNQAQPHPIAQQALARIGELYAIEAQGRDLGIEERAMLRQREAQPRLAALHQWLIATRLGVAEGSALASAIDYSLKRWPALSRYASAGHLPIDNNPVENDIRPVAIGKNNVNCGFMRICRRHICAQRGSVGFAMLQCRSRLRIKTSVFCSGKPTSGDLHGCVRVRSSGARSVAARQRSRAVCIGVRASRRTSRSRSERSPG